MEKLDPSDPARAAARRWLDRSKTPEYKCEKHQRLHFRWQIAALKRKARRDRDYEAIALLKIWEAELLSHQKRVEAALR
jgi:hypothetical protein